VPVQRVKTLTESMQPEARNAQFTQSLPPTVEELAIMMKLNAQMAQLRKTRDVYTSFSNYLYNEFTKTHKEYFSFQDNVNLRAELLEIAHEFGLELLSTSTKAVESVEDLCLRLLEATRSQGIRSDASQLHVQASAFDFDYEAADADSSLTPY